MQHATDWKNVAAEVIPIGVEDEHHDNDAL